jgi:uncharacterized protein (TIGR02611 family)
MIRHTVRAGRVIVGLVLLMIGVVLLFIPGPGFPFVIGGLTLLSYEFEWARRLHDRARTQLDRVSRRGDVG